MRVLIVDDSTFMRRYVRQLLEGSGAMCEESAGGNEALARLVSGERFDVMLLDLNMPEMDGMTCLRQSAGLRAKIGMKVMMVTTEASSSVILEALEEGADEFLMKPFTPACLRDKLMLMDCCDVGENEEFVALR